MSTLDPEIIAKTATLAQLQLSREELAHMARELHGIFPLFAALDRDDIRALAPLGHPLGEVQPLRDDVALKRELGENIAKNAPLAEEGFITVPKVIS